MTNAIYMTMEYTVTLMDITWHGHVAVSSQGMQDHLGAKPANWLAG